MMLHQSDGLTPAPLSPASWMGEKNKRSFIRCRRSQCLLCKVMVLIYLPVQTMKHGDKKNFKKRPES